MDILYNCIHSLGYGPVDDIVLFLFTEGENRVKCCEVVNSRLKEKYSAAAAAGVAAAAVGLLSTGSEPESTVAVAAAMLCCCKLL